MRDVTLLTVRLRPLTAAELYLVRFLSRLAGDGAALFRTLVRMRLLREAISSSLGWRAARGMAEAERALLFLFVDRAVQSDDDLRLKATMVRAFMETNPDGNAGAMLTAALEADAHRLGLLAGDDPEPHGSPTVTH